MFVLEKLNNAELNFFFFFQSKNPSTLAILFSLTNLIISRKAFTAQNGYPSMEGAVYFGCEFRLGIVGFCFVFFSP